MKATDLMIGDWVLMRGTPVQVRAIGVNTIRFSDMLITEPLENIEPIPLTPEILEKIGLEEYGHRGLGYQYWEPLDDKRSIFLEKMPQDDCWYGFVGSGLPDNLDCNEPDTVFKHFSYVHELQHAIKQCEIEKEVVL